MRERHGTVEQQREAVDGSLVRRARRRFECERVRVELRRVRARRDLAFRRGLVIHDDSLVVRGADERVKPSLDDDLQVVVREFERARLDMLPLRDDAERWTDAERYLRVVAIVEPRLHRFVREVVRLGRSARAFDAVRHFAHEAALAVGTQPTQVGGGEGDALH